MSLNQSMRNTVQKKAAGNLDVTHIRPLSEMFSKDELETIPIDNKVGENYFGLLTNQLRAKGGLHSRQSLKDLR